MTDHILKKLSEINRTEWITYEWLEASIPRDFIRVFMKGRQRTPEEGARAADDWDKWWPCAYHELNKDK